MLHKKNKKNNKNCGDAARRRATLPLPQAGGAVAARMSSVVGFVITATGKSAAIYQRWKKKRKKKKKWKNLNAEFYLKTVCIA